MTAQRTAPKIRTESPMAFFKELVDEALVRREVESTEDSNFYLVQLLSRFVCPGGAYADVGRRPTHPLGVMLLTAAQERDAYRRFVLLRTVGDMSLFVSGFCVESLRRRQVGGSYFARLGESAYGGAADTCRPQGSAEIFVELARNFALFAGVLAEVAARCAMGEQAGDAADLRQVWDAWAEEAPEATAEDEPTPELWRGGLFGPDDPIN